MATFRRRATTLLLTVAPLLFFAVETAPRIRL
jgi:hypothetical protein